jgi:hypothetical protein
MTNYFLRINVRSCNSIANRKDAANIREASKIRDTFKNREASSSLEIGKLQQGRQQ